MTRKLKLERVKRDWTQEELSNRSGVGRVSISNIERNGITKVPVYTLEKLATAFEMSISELFFSEEE